MPLREFAVEASHCKDNALMAWTATTMARCSTRRHRQREIMSLPISDEADFLVILRLSQILYDSIYHALQQSPYNEVLTMVMHNRPHPSMADRRSDHISAILTSKCPIHSPIGIGLYSFRTTSTRKRWLLFLMRTGRSSLELIFRCAEQDISSQTSEVSPNRKLNECITTARLPTQSTV